MPKLVLHIGAHKTGTTFLQSTFYNNRALLAEHGIHYPKLDRYKAHHALSNIWLSEDSEVTDVKRKQEAAKVAWDLLLRDYADKDGTVFLSSESFSRSDPCRVDMGELAQRLQPFDDVKLVYTVRDQAAFAQSVWLELNKQNELPSVPRYVDRIVNKRRFGGIWFDHNLVYDHLLTGFNPDQIILLDYNRFKAESGGVVGSFLRLLESDLPADALTAAAPKEANISPDALSFFVASQLTSPDIPSASLIKAVSDIILPDPAPRTMMLRRRQYREVQKRFDLLNERLQRRVQPFQPGFEIKKQPFPDQNMFRENLTEQHWIDIARLMYRQSAPLGRLGLKKNPKILTRILGK